MQALDAVRAEMDALQDRELETINYCLPIAWSLIV